MAEKIMVIDDELDIVNLLRDFFTINDYEVITASNAEDAFSLLKEKPDIILLDINMPEKNGLEFCKEIRSLVNCPIIFLTARTEADDVLLGLNVGGDDYITKPFNIKELLCRVQAHLRREKRSKQVDNSEKSGIKIDYAGMCVTFGDKVIALTKAEFKIVEFLSMNPGIVFDKEKIYENIFGFDSQADNTVIREHIRKIRKKFNAAGCKSYIETVWGIGYRWIK